MAKDHKFTVGLVWICIGIVALISVHTADFNEKSEKALQCNNEICQVFSR